MSRHWARRSRPKRTRLARRGYQYGGVVNMDELQRRARITLFMGDSLQVGGKSWMPTPVFETSPDFPWAEVEKIGRKSSPEPVDRVSSGR